MVAIPVKHRSYITVPKGLETKSMPSPEGFSLVTSHVYTKVIFFFENTHNDPVFYDWQRVKTNLTDALNHYYPFTGRLSKKENGRYDIENFDKGALFEVGDSADSLQDWKKNNFSYGVVPYTELIPVHNYVSRDSPLFACKMTYTIDGGCAVTYVVHHKIADGVCLTEMLKVLSRISRGERIPTDEIFIYTDKMRKPVKPLPNTDHSTLYQTIPVKDRLPPTVKMGPSMKLIFSIGKESSKRLKQDALNKVGLKEAKISQFNIISAFINKAIVKARRANNDSCADVLCIVGNHHKSQDKNMRRYLGNYIMPALVPNTVQDVLDKSIYQLAQEIRQASSQVTVPYLESLEYYFNHHPNVEDIASPIQRIMYGAVGMSDWSRFTEIYENGLGPWTAMRSYVDSSPLPLITFLTYTPEGTMNVVIQLDCESMERLKRDPDFIKYIDAIN